MDMFLIGLLLFCILGAVGVLVFAIAYFGVASSRLADEEKGLQPIHRERCGGLFGGVYWPSPYVRFAVYQTFLVVAYGRTRHVMRFDEIQDVSKKSHLFWKGIHIRHHRPDIPRSFIIRPRDPNRAMQVLREQGVPVSAT
jgi:hypothetical protein